MSISTCWVHTKHLPISFNELCGFVSICEANCIDKPYSFHALQLQHILCDNEESIGIEIPRDELPHSNPAICNINCNNIIQGFAGDGDYATVFSREGAERFLEFVAERPFIGMERLFYEQRSASRGFYSYVGNRNGIVHDYGRVIDEELT